MVTVTIGIPVYNEEKYLADTINSAINQTFRDIKIIISDNCSSDKSYDIAQQYASLDSRIQCIRHTENIGVSKNFKYVLEISETVYFMWLGAHDLLETEFIESAIKVLDSQSNIGLVYSKSILIDKQNVVVNQSFYDDIDTLGLDIEKKLFKVAQNLFNCFSIHGLFRTNLLKKVKMSNTLSGDHTLLFDIATLTDIKLINIYGLRCREVRKEKSFKETLERLKNSGLNIDLEMILPSHTPMVIEHLDHIWQNNNISLLAKARIFIGIQGIFSNRFGVSWLAILGTKSIGFRYIYLLEHLFKTIFNLFKTAVKSFLKLN
jgi:glycosyltransferase involved in cell wall biosynthesis